MTAVVLTPVRGAPVNVDPSGWAQTVDLLAEHQVLHPTVLGPLRDAPGLDVTAEQAERIAAFAGTWVTQSGLDAADAQGLLRLRDFCRWSGGFRATRLADDRRPALPTAIATTEPPAWQTRLRRVLGPFAVIVIVIVKWVAKLKALIFVLPKLKLIGPALSALVSIGAYALFWGLPFAAVFVLLLFIHEMGHVIQLRREGVPSTAPMFIPFLGAVVGMKGLPKDAWVEAKVGLAGPVLGSVGALACWGVAEATNSNLLRAAAHTGFLLNLFNLAPIVPLDGGRAAAAIHPVAWLVGLFGIAALFFARPNVILLLIVVIGAREAYVRFREFRSGDPAVRAYYRIRGWQRVVVALVFFGLAGALVLAMSATYVPRPG